ncbi:hypothetical protein [Nonomuraea basaltis]|nr:hypothetical protein [Nonomuraea basaltis]
MAPVAPLDPAAGTARSRVVDRTTREGLADITDPVTPDILRWLDAELG